MPSKIKMGKEKIAILLATYNGEHFLAQQINSVLNQTFTNWTLYIRDDGSTDSTLGIIKDYVNKHSNIVLLDPVNKNLGAMNSFLWLLENINSDYYMFCDQDDVWLPNKIELSYAELRGLELNEKNLPALVFSDLFVVNQSLEIIANSMWEYSRLNRIMEPDKYLFAGPLATGCTMIFNRAAKTIALLNVKHAVMHDALLALAVLTNGGRIKALYTPLIYYRQHNGNVLGALKFNASILKKLVTIKKIITDNYLYFRFVNSFIKISIFKFLLLKTKIALKVRDLI